MTAKKDTRYIDAAQNAVETLENRGVVAANDDYEVEPIDTHTPSSWKELAELEARNRAAERLVQISEESGDVVDNGEIRTNSMDDEPKSMPAWLHNHDEEYADIEEFDTDDSVENDAYGTNESGPAEYSYQPTTIGPLETNHAAIASAVPGTVPLLVLLVLAHGMSSMPLSVPSLASTAEDTAQVAVSKDGQIHRTYDKPYHFPSLDNFWRKGEVGQKQ